MMPLKRMLALAPLASALIASPASAQDDDFYEDDDPLVVIDEHLDGLHDQLENLQQRLSLDVSTTMDGINQPCENGEDCEIRIIVKDGEQVVIVNGDTVSAGDVTMPNLGMFAYRFHPWMERHGRLPGLRLDREFERQMHSFGDPELRKMEQEAHTIARKARDTKGAKKVELEKQLDQKLNEIFDYKLDRRKKAIEKAEEHVAEMKEREAKRESARDEIIRNRKDELLGTERYLEW